MFEKRNDLLKFLSVAETGKISTAADRLGMTQPALSASSSGSKGSSGAGCSNACPPASV